MAAEFSRHAPPGVEYSFIRPLPSRFRLIRTSVKGAFLARFESRDLDLIEAVLFPIRTTNPWVYSCENLQAATAFNLLGLPLPRWVRVGYLRRLLAADNCRRVMFWSHAGRKTLATYGSLEDPRVLEKVSVVYPAIREVPDDLIRFPDGEELELLFSGEFFRKGGVNVVDAFERLQPRYPGVRLTLCCDEKIDFRTPNTALRKEYLEKIRRNKGINWLGRVPREKLIHEILPRVSIYLLPTYYEAFGFAVLEAMAFGIPVIATNHFAIPEILEHNVSGLLVDTERFNCEQLFRGYTVREIPEDLRATVTEGVYESLIKLIESAGLRKRFGTAGVQIARTKFSFEERNKKMLALYQAATA